MVKLTGLVCCLLVILFTAEARDISGSVSCDDKKIIVDRHNEFRRQVAQGKLDGQPKASNMKALVWDDQLEILAQNWSLQGKLTHNVDRHDDRWQVGENIYFLFNPNDNNQANWTAAIDDWFSENKVYTYSKEFAMATGHYTQLVWADTMYVGCGFSHYREKDMTTGTYVCNYGPAGNWVGQYPYETGTGCEDLCCTTQCDVQYGSKCT